jgi:hypothetical protein
MALRDFIREVPPLSFEDVPVPEWKGQIVRIVELDGIERIDYGDEYTGAKEEAGSKRAGVLLAMAQLVVRTARDPETGAAQFTADDVDVLARRHSAVVIRLFTVAARLNIVSEKEVDQTAGKSEGVPPSVPPTA